MDEIPVDKFVGDQLRRLYEEDLRRPIPDQLKELMDRLDELDLPPHVRVFVEGLNKEDVETLKSGITMLRSALTVVRFLKWLLGAGIIAFTTMAALGDSFFKIKGWWK